MSETPRPYFWIRRNGNTYVPLIPVDELPSWVGVRGVSTTKNWNDVCQGEMRFLGDHDDHNGGHFVVDVFNSAEEGSSESESSLSTPTEKAFTDSDNQKAKVHTEKASDGTDKVQANVEKIITAQDGRPDENRENSQQDTLKYQGTAGTLGKKVYCTYWIRTGNCNYMQEGCKYKHEIPPDDETRLAIGVRTYPTWPREDPVCNPRPPPVKASPLQKPALQQSWRLAATVPTKVEQSGSQKTSQKTSHRPKPRKLSEPNAGSTAPRSTQTKSNPSPPGNSSGSHQPAGQDSRPAPPIAAANAAQHFPSHAQASTSVLTHGNARQQAPTTTTMDPSNSRSAHPTVLLRNPLPAKPINVGQSLSPFTQSPQTPMAAPQTNTNPFTQRVASNRVSMTGNTPPFGVPYKSTYPLGAPTGNAQFPHPPPFMPGHISNSILHYPRSGTPTATGNQAPVGEIYYNLYQKPRAGSSGLGSSSANGHGTEPATHNSSNNPNSSGSDLNTPRTSNDTAPEAFNSNVATDSSTTASGNSGSRAATPAVVSSKPSGNSTDLAFGIIDARTQTPSSVKGRGPVLFNPNEGNVSPAVSTKGNSGSQQPATLSPPPVHRRMFRAPGEAEFVANPLEEAHSKSYRTTKKHVSGQSSTKVKKSGSGKHPRKSQDLLI